MLEDRQQAAIGLADGHSSCDIWFVYTLQPLRLVTLAS